MSEHIKNDIQTIADHYGKIHQLIKLAEECGEVVQAATKLALSDMDNKNQDIERLYDNLYQELADLSILSDQVVYLLGCEEEIAEWRKYKLKRTISEINRKPFNSDRRIQE